MFGDRPKFVILEGTDGSGKSYLAKQIYGDFECRDIQPTGPPLTDDPFAEYVADVSRFLYYREMTVFDRFHFGTFAYGKEFRGKPDLDSDQFSVVERLLKNLGTLVILCEPPWDIVLKNIEAREEKSEFEEDTGRLGRVRDSMRECFNVTELRKHRYDYTIRGAYEDLYGVVERMGFARRPGR